jgi:NitT/TauT family transport system substrate-binding protein
MSTFRKGEKIMRIGFKTLVAVVISVTFILSSFNSVSLSKEPDKLTFGLNYIWYGVHGYFIPALKLGYYKDANLDVDIKRGYGSGDAIKRAFIGQADIALTDLNSLVVARAQGVQVKSIGVLENLAPHCVIARRDHGIKTLKDLEGKTFGGAKTDGNIIMLPTLCELAGLDFSKIKLVTVDSQAKDPLLLTGKVDAIGQFQAGGATRYKKLAQREKIDLTWFPYFQYGFKAYGLSLVASEKMIGEKQEVLRRFLAATYKGVAWALDNPEKTIKMYAEFRPEMAKEDLEDGFNDGRNLIIPNMHPNGLGWFDKDRVKFTVDVTVKAQDLKPVGVDDMYTNELLPKIKPASK